MTIKRKLVVSPIDADTVPIVRYRNSLKEYLLHGIIAPIGWGYNNKDVSCIDGGPDLGFIVSNDFEKSINECDSVLFNISNSGTDIMNYITPQIEIASMMNKEILISAPIENRDKCDQLEEKYQAKLLYKNNDLNYRNTYKKLHKIYTPIILVAGLGECCNKFETQLSTKEYFESLGYNVCHIGSKSYSGIFGINPVPYFLFSNEYSIKDKIYFFNYFIKELEKEHNPDIFIIGVPGGLMPFDNIATNHFGELAHIISYAIKADAVVLNHYFNFFTDRYFSEIDNCCKYKFDFNVIGHVIANTKYDLNLEDKENYLSFLSLNSQFVLKNIPIDLKEKWNIFNVFESDIQTSIAKLAHENLTSNINTVRNI